MNRVKKKKRIICFTASCGGHLEELSKLSELVGKHFSAESYQWGGNCPQLR